MSGQRKDNEKEGGQYVFQNLYFSLNDSFETFMNHYRPC